MLEILPARSGEPTARIGGAYLHSPYDPLAEASRFAQRSLAGTCPDTVLLLGAELGHAGRAIRDFCPQARLLPVYYDGQLAARGPQGWSPASGEPLLDFLRRCLPSAEGLAILEWPASARLFPQASLEARRRTAQVLRELRGGLATTAAVGRRWLRNCLDNFLSIDRALAASPPPSALPVLIAASGPSLQGALPALQRLRERIELWALPSAAECLRAHGLAPDLIVLTDPGWYALAHLLPLASAAIPVAMPLSAAAGAWRFAGGVLLLGQDAAYENSLLAAAGYPAWVVPPHGTVAATALELALRRSARQVILAGLDLCFQDLLGHARPNLFERALEAESDRLQPLHQRRFAWALSQAPRRLAAGARTGLALETYAGWFAGRSADPRLYRLLPSAVPLPGFRPLDLPGLERLLSGPSPARLREGAVARLQPGYPDRAGRLRILRDLLADWRGRAQGLEERLRLGRNLGELDSDPLLLSLAAHFDAAGLAASRRAGRLQGGPAAAARAALVLDALQRFLAERQERLDRAA
jgi:hypothetical protein